MTSKECTELAAILADLSCSKFEDGCLCTCCVDRRIVEGEFALLRGRLAHCETSLRVFDPTEESEYWLRHGSTTAETPEERK